MHPVKSTLTSIMSLSSLVIFIGCLLGFIQFLNTLVADKLELSYAKLKQSLKRRPSLTEFWNSGVNLSMLQRNYGSWWEFLDEQGDANGAELQVLEKHVQWFRDLTITRLSKSYKLVLLATLMDQHRIARTVSLQDLAGWAKHWFQRHSEWKADLPASLQDLETLTYKKWFDHWRDNPIKFW